MAKVGKKNWRKIFRLESNPVVRTLTISDIFFLSGMGLINPIFAVFLTNQIVGGNLEVVGIASTIYFLTKSLGQLPIAQIIDRIKGEKDDFLAMVIGSAATSLVPLLYLLATRPLHIYLIQFLYGLAQATVFPAWLAIFTRHVDSSREGTQWGMYYTMIDLIGAGAASLGGVIAYNFGFLPLFVIASILSFFGCSWLLLVRNEMRKR